MSKQEIDIIEPVEQKTVVFMEDELVAVRTQDDIYVSVAHLSDALGLDRQGQTQRIERNSVLVSGYRQGEIATPGGPQMSYLLRVDLVPFWLAGVNTRRIKDKDRRNKVELYQQNVAKVLWEAFQEGRLTTDTTFDDLLRADTPAVQAYKTAQAMMRLARQQILLEAKMDTYDERLEDYEQRLEAIEASLGDPKRHITPSQAMQISQAVKAIAMELTKRTGRNEYGGVYGELYRKFEINSYKLLPAHKFEVAMQFLNAWYQDLVGDTPF